jgi:hypothetical protein
MKTTNRDDFENKVGLPRQLRYIAGELDFEGAQHGFEPQLSARTGGTN